MLWLLGGAECWRRVSGSRVVLACVLALLCQALLAAGVWLCCRRWAGADAAARRAALFLHPSRDGIAEMAESQNPMATHIRGRLIDRVAADGSLAAVRQPMGDSQAKVRCGVWGGGDAWEGVECRLRGYLDIHLGRAAQAAGPAAACCAAARPPHAVCCRRPVPHLPTHLPRLLHAPRVSPRRCPAFSSSTRWPAAWPTSCTRAGTPSWWPSGCAAVWVGGWVGWVTRQGVRAGTPSRWPSGCAAIGGALRAGRGAQQVRARAGAWLMCARRTRHQACSMMRLLPCLLAKA